MTPPKILIFLGVVQHSASINIGSGDWLTKADECSTLRVEGNSQKYLFLTYQNS